MFILQILAGTPPYVWLVLAALVGLGWTQSRPRAMGRTRVAVLPAALLVLSFVGGVGAFGYAVDAVGAWIAGVAVAIAAGPLLLPRPGAAWSADRGSVRVAGSWWPMALIVGLFATRYVAAVSLALHPEEARDAAFSVPFCFVFGAFSGLFVSRALQMWRARRAAAA